MQSALKPAGIDLAIKTYSYRTMFAADGPINGGSFDLELDGWPLNSDADLSELVDCNRWFPRGQNIDRFCDPRVDALERAGLQTDDPSSRALLYRRADRLIWSEVPYVPLWSPRRLIVRSADLHDFSVSPVGWSNTWQWDI